MSQETRAAVLRAIDTWCDLMAKRVEATVLYNIADGAAPHLPADPPEGAAINAALDAHEADILRRTGVSDERMYKAVKDVLILNGVAADMAWDGYTIIDEAVADIVRESEQVAQQLAEALREYETWEAALILEAKCWADGLPMFTQPMYDYFMAIQSSRNRALALYEQHSASRTEGVR